MRKSFVALLVSAVVITLSGCANTFAPADLLNQKPTWVSCESGKFECATIKAPIDWNASDGKTFDLALVRKGKAGKLGFLLLNPGGPGGSGYDFLVNNYEDIGTADLRAAYSFVSFDPRGVGRSSAVKCLDAKGTDHLLYDSNAAVPGSAEDLKLQTVELKKFTAGCKQNTGELLGHVDTISAAKDMDLIRTALGEVKLNYLGYSYGTFLGSTYASLFPEKVGRFVLDGAIDPRVTDEQQTANQLAGFDLALSNYLKDCLANDNLCPFSGTLDEAKSKVKKFLFDMESKELKTKGDRKLTLTSASTGLIMALYSDTYWQYLTQAFNEAFIGDGTTFLSLADFYNDRNVNGGYDSNSLEANLAVNCLDSRASSKPEDMAAQNANLLEVSPILGRYWQNGAITCSLWPYPKVGHLSDYSAKGAPRIMVVGTTGDPATPYEQSVALAHDVLVDGYLVTFDGEGHTAYGRSNECVSRAVDGFLIDGKFDAKEPVC